MDSPQAPPARRELTPRLGRLRRWWLHRLPRTHALRLTQSNIYILPTRAGWMLGVTLLLLLVGSINYQLNLGYLLTFLLTGCAAVSVLVTHHNLRGLTLTLQASSGVFAGQAAPVPVVLQNGRSRARYAIALQWLPTQATTAVRVTTEPAWTDVPARDSASVLLPCPPLPRGRWAVPALQAESCFPLGIFRVWCWWRPAGELLVYPAPETAPPPLPLGPGTDETEEPPSLRPAPDSSAPDGLRPYRRGDPLKWLLWKKVAQLGDDAPERWVRRDFEPSPAGELWLDAAQCGLSDPEGRWSRLCAWVLQAEQAGLSYGLRLPGHVVPLGQGTAHRLRCLEALACC
ncbi:MAG TPA: DUF58 domain-containing protein [Burkholderiaceae bacterium]|nr:DUF58 domain-containing protein [Burkholderiaceae bacterium]